MKAFRYTLAILLTASLFLTIGCGDDDDNTASIEDQQLDALVGVWATTSTSDVKLGGDDAPGDWSNFSIEFDNLLRVSTNGVPSDANIFNTSTFNISGDNATLLMLNFNNSETETAIAEINENSMTLTFSLSSNNDQLGARQKSITVVWTFFLQRQ